MKRTLNLFCAALLAAALLSLPGHSGAQGSHEPIVSDFEPGASSTDVDGWRLSYTVPNNGVAYLFNLPVAALNTHVLVGHDGNGDSAIVHQPPDSGYFRAPSRFLGDVSWTYGRVLRFTLRTSAAEVGGVPFQSGKDVHLVGAGRTLTAELAPDPTRDDLRATFVNFTLRLADPGPWIVDSTGLPATRQDLEAVLGDLQDLLIRCNWYNRFDITSLDNVVLGGGAGKVRLNQGRINFGPVRVGRSRSEVLTISNRSNRRGDTLTVHVLGTVDPFFSQFSNDRIDIPPGHFLRVRVSFAPQEVGRQTGSHHLQTSDPDFPDIVVPLKGSGRGRR